MERVMRIIDAWLNFLGPYWCSYQLALPAQPMDHGYITYFVFI
jgi:hypothetical protein